jgi:uncharacterized damage-inducible protein DinB
MSDAHENLKKVLPSDEFKYEYNTIIETFSKRSISDTLKHIRDGELIWDKSFSS